MTGRDWKPGEVGLVECSDGEYRPALYGWRPCGKAWTFKDGSYRSADDSDARPLTVIDPEDRAQVERLIAAFWANGTDDCDDTLDMQAALRSLVTPPKPEEPTGLGAVVEDADGDRWVRCRADQPGLLGVTWENERTCAHKPWPHIAAVKVLSEGVTE